MKKMLSLHGLPRHIFGEPFTCDVEQGIIEYIDCYMNSFTFPRSVMYPHGKVQKWWWAIPVVDIDVRDSYGTRYHEYSTPRKMIILNRTFFPWVPDDAVFVGVIDDVIENVAIPGIQEHRYTVERFYLYDMGYVDEHIPRKVIDDEI